MDLENKYVVFKTEWTKVLNPHECRELFALLDKIAVLNGKRENRYVVCNLDEPYADDVLKIIENGEKSKDGSN